MQAFFSNARVGHYSFVKAMPSYQKTEKPENIGNKEDNAEGDQLPMGINNTPVENKRVLKRKGGSIARAADNSKVLGTGSPLHTLQLPKKAKSTVTSSESLRSPGTFNPLPLQNGIRLPNGKIRKRYGPYDPSLPPLNAGPADAAGFGQPPVTSLGGLISSTIAPTTMGQGAGTDIGKQFEDSLALVIQGYEENINDLKAKKGSNMTEIEDENRMLEAIDKQMAKLGKQRALHVTTLHSREEEVEKYQTAINDAEDVKTKLLETKAILKRD